MRPPDVWKLWSTSSVGTCRQRGSDRGAIQLLVSSGGWDQHAAALGGLARSAIDGSLTRWGSSTVGGSGLAIHFRAHIHEVGPPGLNHLATAHIVEQRFKTAPCEAWLSVDARSSTPK
jgi:hypothetical protein